MNSTTMPSSSLVPEIVLLLTIAVSVAFTPAADERSLEKECTADEKKCVKSKCAGGSHLLKNMFGGLQIDAPLLITAKGCATVDKCTKSLMTNETLDLTCQEMECCDGEMCNGPTVPPRNRATVSRHFSSKATGLIFTILLAIFKELDEKCTPFGHD